MLYYLAGCFPALRRRDLFYLYGKDLSFEDRLSRDGLFEQHIVTAIDLTHLLILFLR